MVWKILSPFVLQKKWEHLRVDRVGTSPVVQWLGTHLPMPRTQVWSPVRGSRVPQSSWACVFWSPHGTSREPTPRSWRSPWAATKTQPATKNRRVGQVTGLIRKVLRICNLTSSQKRFSKTMEEWPPEASEITRAALPLQTLSARAPEEWFQRMGPTPRLRQSQAALTPCLEVGPRPRAAAGTVPSRPEGTWKLLQALCPADPQGHGHGALGFKTQSLWRRTPGRQPQRPGGEWPRGLPAQRGWGPPSVLGRRSIRPKRTVLSP